MVAEAWTELLEVSRDIGHGKAVWAKQCFQEAKERWENGEWRRMYTPREHTPVQNTCPPQVAVESAHPVTEHESAPQEINKCRTNVEEHVNRIEEESRCHEWLVELTWQSKINKTEDTVAESHKMSWLVWKYLKNHTNDPISREDAIHWPTNLRLWLAEFTWCMDELHRRQLFPRMLTHPMDKALRIPAAAAGGCSAEDPGNINWDVLVCLSRFWKYVDQSLRHKVHRIDTSAYGQANTSKSSAGSCNFRGNMMEAFQYYLQEQSSGQDVHDVQHESAREKWPLAWG